jgi:hypothetical protein
MSQVHSSFRIDMYNVQNELFNSSKYIYFRGWVLTILMVPFLKNLGTCLTFSNGKVSVSSKE